MSTFFSYALPVLYAIFIWWFSTGLILYLDGLPKQTFRWSMLAATALLLAPLLGLVENSKDASVIGAYIGFTYGVLIWGWLEMSYYMGFITGPRKTPCPTGCSNWQRFLLAIQTSLYHELAIITAASIMLVLTWGAANQIGVWTFLLLWGMRWSAKLNIFLGVPNLNYDWLPEHLQFLQTYVVKKPINLLFPLSVTTATAVLMLLIMHIVTVSADAFTTAGLSLLATLLTLAIIEHWLLILPLPDQALWRWSLQSRQTTQQSKNGYLETAPAVSHRR